MALAGALAMGLFVGLFMAQNPQFSESSEPWIRSLATILGVFFGSALVSSLTLPKDESRRALAMYGVGYVLGYAWSQMPIWLALAVYPGIGLWVGLAGIVGNVLITAVALTHVFPAAAREAGIFEVSPIK